MKFPERYLLAKTWQEKCTIINLYHQIKCAKFNKWTLRKSASYFELSLGYVSESLQLASRIDEVRKCETRKEALEFLKKELKK